MSLDKINHAVGNFFKNTVEKAYSINAHIREFNKYRAPIRKEIYNSITLTKEQKLQIDKLYKENYGKKVPYTWHRHYTAFTGSFDPYYFPELLYIPEFERYMNLKSAYAKVFEDKNVIPFLCSAAGIATPKVIFSCTAGLIKNAEGTIIDKEQLINEAANMGEAFIKPTVGSCSGNGCAVVSFSDGKDSISGLDINTFLDNYSTDWVIQERVRCHESLSNIYPNSVNTFRIITYRWKDEIRHIGTAMRIGQGGNTVDNIHAGGLSVAIDDTGHVIGDGFTEFTNGYECHPNTGVVFRDCVIPLFPSVLQAAKKCHTYLPQVGIVNWDFTIDDSGQPVLIEANIGNGGIWLMQMAYGHGPFGDDTAEILRWMKLMRHTKSTDRYKYAFGVMPEEK